MSAPGIREAMRAAIEASERVRGTTSPNPPVGAVVLDRDGVVAGVGATDPPGGPHAEVVALRAAGERARGGTAVVTLEPCSHHGRTPPCTQALLAAGVATVYYAATDPHPVASGGASVLRAAGVVMHKGPLTSEVEGGPLRAWLHWSRSLDASGIGQSHVTWKFAATLDGRVAAADGSSRWISSPASRAQVHELRRKVDAIVVGKGTVLVDDPQLTARDENGGLAERQPLRVVVGAGELPADARVLDGVAETLVLRTRDPSEVLAALAERHAVDVLLEGGPRLAGGFLASGAVHRVLAYLAPKLLGAGPVALGEMGIASITDALRLEIEEVTMSGPDVLISAVPVLVDTPGGRA